MYKLTIIYFLMIASIFAQQDKIQFFEKSNGVYKENSSLASKFPVKVAANAIDQYQIAQRVAYDVQLAKAGYTSEKRKTLVSGKTYRPVIVQVHSQWFKNKRPTTFMGGVSGGTKVLENGTRESIKGQPLIMLKHSHTHHSGLVHETGHAIMNALYQGKNLPSGGGSHGYNKLTSKGLAYLEGFAEFFTAAHKTNSHIKKLKYSGKSPSQLNQIEGFTASVMLQLFNKFGIKGIFQVMAETKPRSFAEFAESYMQRYPDQAETLLAAMQNSSGNAWPTAEQIKEFKENGVKGLDLDGNGVIYGAKNLFVGTEFHSDYQWRDTDSTTPNPSSAGDSTGVTLGDVASDNSSSTSSSGNLENNPKVSQLEQQLAAVKKKQRKAKKWLWIPFLRGKKLRSYSSQISSLESQIQQERQSAASDSGVAADPQNDHPTTAYDSDLNNND
ncbi:MAG: hypothetical protein KC646_00240 [Candidatus Cloacimonetes bacterium]|nr:hypothetical protein [Candidatus Cloacimonadota bacterium]